MIRAGIHTYKSRTGVSTPTRQVVSNMHSLTKNEADLVAELVRARSMYVVVVGLFGGGDVAVLCGVVWCSFALRC